MGIIDSLKDEMDVKIQNKALEEAKAAEQASIERAKHEAYEQEFKSILAGELVSLLKYIYEHGKKVDHKIAIGPYDLGDLICYHKKLVEVGSFLKKYSSNPRYSESFTIYTDGKHIYEKDGRFDHDESRKMSHKHFLIKIDGGYAYSSGFSPREAVEHLLRSMMERSI